MAQVNYTMYNSIFKRICIFMMIAAVAIIVLCHFDTKNRIDSAITTEIKPFSVAKLEDGSEEYFFDLSDYDYHYSGIMFYTSHQAVTGYNGGREIYSFNKTGGIWTSTTGSNFNFIEINEKMIQIAVVVTPMYDAVDNQELTFYIGSSYEMYDEVMVESMPRFIASLLIVILSVLIIIYYRVMQEKQQLSNELQDLGHFAFFSGLWSLNETDVATLVIENRIVGSMISYMCLMMVIPPMIMFFDSYLSIHCKVCRKIIITLSAIQFVVLNILHFTKIAEFRQTLPIMQLMLIIGVLYAVFGVVNQIKNGRYSRHVSICAIGLVLFLSAILVDTYTYYHYIGDSDKIGRYVFLVFVFLLAWDMIKDANEMIEKGRRAKQLEIFALTDSMTGLLNRNAFETQAKSDHCLEGVVAVVADANGLKKCNDTFGHEAGDEYITVVAEIFSSVYGKYGNCYRTGGDEFCCIIFDGENVNMERLKKLFLTKIYTANMEGNYKFDIAVAIGSAEYDDDVDADFRALVKRADASMYEDKKEYKAQIS